MRAHLCVTVAVLLSGLASGFVASDADDGAQAILTLCNNDDNDDGAQRVWKVVAERDGLFSLQQEKGYSDRKCLDIHEW
jgi:hypothetical protein